MSPSLYYSAPKPRNKLRKLLKRRPDSIITNASPRCSTDSRRDSSEAHGKLVPRSPSHQLSPSVPPDLSDPKWQEYVRRSGFLLPMEKSPHLEHTRTPPTPSSPIPEFAHLAVTAPPRSPHRLPEALLAPPSPKSTLSSSSSIRRKYAKTPVLRIGQLECEPPPTELGHRSPDAELFAEQYRALLDAQSHEDLGVDARVGEDLDERHAAKTRQHTLDTIRSAVTRRSPLPPLPPLHAPPPPPHAHVRQLTPPTPDFDHESSSPVSDGTLVDFEEDAAIYFKPAFSPEALSPILEDEDASPPPPGPDALSLQITMELLVKELAGTLQRNRPQSGVTEVPPLQTWLMIEAYERLWDQVLDMHLPMEEARALQDLFDVWLRALYKVHDGLAGGQDNVKGVYSPSEFESESLQTVDLS